MKKFAMFLVLLLAVVVLPFNVLAEEATDDSANEEVEVINEDGTESDSEESTEESNEVKIYFFRGEGCPHCADAEEWFESIEEEYGSKFEIIDYETWNNEDNAELMQKVADAREEEATGVPYIIIGNHSWNGFADDYTDEMLDAINSEYETPVAERYDIMKLLPDEAAEEEKSSSSDVVSLILILIVVGAAVFGVVQARKSTY